MISSDSSLYFFFEDFFILIIESLFLEFSFESLSDSSSVSDLSSDSDFSSLLLSDSFSFNFSINIKYFSIIFCSSLNERKPLPSIFSFNNNKIYNALRI